MGDMWLGPERGALTDWITQQWVKLTGRRISMSDAPWLAGPAAGVQGIGYAFFDELAHREGLVVERSDGVRGLLNFDELAGPSLSPSRVDPAVRAFFERTSLFEMDSWSEWCGAFKPLGWVLARVFSRRLQQLNMPLKPLDSSEGTTSEVLQLRDPRSHAVVYTAWVRTLRRTRNVLYSGSYSVTRVPGHPNPCVKVVFPLPNGNAVVILKPEIDEHGAFTITSSGSRFADPGFYFTVHGRDGRVWARYVRTMRETIRVYPSENGEVRTDHTFRVFRLVFLRLHYRLRPIGSALPAA
jgi:hypothetical protein